MNHSRLCEWISRESSRLNLRVAPEPWGPVSHARVLEFSEPGHPGWATSLQLMLAAGPTEDEARAATSQQQQLCPQLLPPWASQQPVHWLLGFGWGLGAQGFAELTQCPWLERGRAGLTPRWVLPVTVAASPGCPVVTIAFPYFVGSEVPLIAKSWPVWNCCSCGSEI